MGLLCWVPLTGDVHDQGLCPQTWVNTSTTNITVLSGGKIGSCYHFNSTTTNTGIQAISSIIMPKINNHSWSIGFWARSDSTSTCALSLTYGLRVFIGSSPRTYLYNTSRSITCTSSVSTTDGLWHHIFTTYDVLTGKIKMYIDGNCTGTATYPAEDTYSSSWDNGIFIGRDPNNNTLNDTYYYRGDLNDVRIYDEALSVKQLEELSKGLIAHYKLSDTTTNITTNLGKTSATYSNYANGYVTNGLSWGGNAGTWTYYRFGGYNNYPYKVYHKTATGTGGCYNKTADDIYIQAGKTYTMSIYIKASANLTDSAYNFNINRGSDNYYISFGTAPVITTDWKRFEKTFTATTDQEGYYGERSIIYGGDVGIDVYYSGFQIEENSFATPYVQTSSYASSNLITSLSAGGRTTVSGNNIVTTGENADTYFYLNLGTTLTLEKTYRISLTASGITTGQQFTFAIGSSSNTSIGTFQIKNGYNEFVFVANSACCSSAKLILDDTLRPSTATVCTFSNIKLEEIVNKEFDCSGYQNHILHKVNCHITSDSHRYTQSQYFTNTALTNAGDYIRGNMKFPTSQCTINYWFKCSGNGGGGYHVPINLSKTSPYTIHYVDKTSGLRYFIAINGTSYSNTIVPGTTVCDNKWHMITTTFDGSQIKAYFDSVLKITQSVSGTLSYNDDIISIGRGYNESRFNSDCYENDVRIYASALTQNQIKELYNITASIDKNKNLFSREFIETTNTNKQICASGQTVFLKYQEFLQNYTLLEYINCQNKYISIPNAITGTPILKAKFKLNVLSTSNYICGCRNYIAIAGGSGGKINTLYGPNQYATVSYDTDTIYNVEISNQKNVVNNVSYTIPTSAISSTFPATFTLGGWSSSELCNGKIYYVELINSDNNRYYLLPCINKSNNAVGFYDIYHNIFYTGSGSGSFTSGPVVQASVHKSGDVSMLSFIEY